MKALVFSAVLLVVVMLLNWLFVKFIVRPYEESLKREYRSVGKISFGRLGTVKLYRCDISPHLKLVNIF